MTRHLILLSVLLVVYLLSGTQGIVESGEKMEDEIDVVDFSQGLNKFHKLFSLRRTARDTIIQSSDQVCKREENIEVVVYICPLNRVCCKNNTRCCPSTDVNPRMPASDGFQFWYIVIMFGLLLVVCILVALIVLVRNGSCCKKDSIQTETAAKVELVDEKVYSW